MADHGRLRPPGHALPMRFVVEVAQLDVPEREPEAERGLVARARLREAEPPGQHGVHREVEPVEVEDEEVRPAADVVERASEEQR